MVTAMDDAVGNIVSYLTASNLMENTYIVFTTDVSCCTTIAENSYIHNCRMEVRSRLVAVTGPCGGQRAPSGKAELVAPLLFGVQS